MACFFPPKILFSCGILWFVLFVVIKSEEAESSLSPCEIERLLKPILSPPDERTIQAQALRQRLINLIRQGFEEQVDNGIEEKRSISSLARWDNLPVKRNLQALARSGYLKSLPADEDMDDNDANLKRSIQYLARSGQLPDFQSEDSKRSISSLARNGELHNNRRELEELIDELYEKRNIGSLARDFNFPSYGKRFLGSLARSGDLGKRNLASIVRNGKRSLASLVRSNNLPEGLDEYKRNIASLAREGGKFVGKRNVAALLRQDNYLNERHHHEDDEDAQTQKPEGESDEMDAAKRNLASIKAGRSKRQADYYDVQNEEYPQPVYQNQNSMDYEELVHALTGTYPAAEKRFLGRLPQMGKPKTTPTPKVRRRRISGFY